MNIWQIGKTKKTYNRDIPERGEIMYKLFLDGKMYLTDDKVGEEIERLKDRIKFFYMDAGATEEEAHDWVYGPETN